MPRENLGSLTRALRGILEIGRANHAAMLHLLEIRYSIESNDVVFARDAHAHCGLTCERCQQDDFGVMREGCGGGAAITTNSAG